MATLTQTGSTEVLFKEFVKKNTAIDDFFYDLGEILSTEFWIYDCPRGIFAKLNGEEQYLKDFFDAIVDRLHPQAFLNELINVFLDCSRYFHEYEYLTKYMITVLHSKGARFTEPLLKQLLDRNYDEVVSFEDEVINYNVKSELLIIAYKIGDNRDVIVNYADWKNIPHASWWEDVETNASFDYMRLQLLKIKPLWNKVDKERVKKERKEK